MAAFGKNIVATLLLFASLIMPAMAVVPHHHHANGSICMKQDLPAEQQCPNHSHHHPESDPCCGSECPARFCFPAPSAHTVFMAALPVDMPVEYLLRPQEKRIKNYYAYRDTLHDADICRTASLRAPPCSVFASKKTV